MRFSGPVRAADIPAPRAKVGVGARSKEEARERKGMARRDRSPDFIEALARGLDVIRVFQPRQPVMSLAAVAGAAGLAPATAPRVLLTLEQLGYVRASDGGFELTPRILELGMAYVLSRNLWDVARPHMEWLVSQTHESSSI